MFADAVDGVVYFREKKKTALINVKAKEREEKPIWIFHRYFTRRVYTLLLAKAEKDIRIYKAGRIIFYLLFFRAIYALTTADNHNLLYFYVLRFNNRFSF